MRNAVARDKNRADSWFQLGRLQRRAGDTKAAADALGQAITLNPNHALARVELGRQALAAGNSDGAERHFLTALRADPDCVPALISLASSLLDNKASSGEKESLEQAHKHAARAVQLRPQNPEAQLVRSEEHTSKLQSRGHLVCRLLLEKKKSGAATGILKYLFSS